MAEKNSLWKNIRNKAKQNRASGATPKKPTVEMLRQERKIRAKHPDGGPVNTLEGDLISKVIMNRNRDKDFVRRAYAVGEYPESNMFVQPDANEFGDKNSHLMSWGEDESGQAYMYPEVMNPNNEAVKVPNQYADYISSTGYKKATGIPHAQGGYYPTQGPGKALFKGYAEGGEDDKKKTKSDYSEPRYVTERSTTSTKNTPALSTKKENSNITRGEDTLQAIKLGLDVGQFTPLAPVAYAASLPFTTADVVKNIYNGNYKQAAAEALGYIPMLKGFKAAGRANTFITTGDILNDAGINEKSNGGYTINNNNKSMKNNTQSWKEYLKYAQGGRTNPYNQYQDDQYLQYEVGGKVWKNIAAGLYGAGEGILDTVTMGATDDLTDKGFEALSKAGNKNIDLNNPDDVKFLKSQQKVKGYSNAAGAIGTAAVTGNVQGAIKQGTKGLNTAFQATDGMSDDFKKWSQGVTGVAGVASGFAGGLNSSGFSAAQEAGTGVAGFGQKVGKYSPLINQASGFIGGNEQPLWQQGQAQQEQLNSTDYLSDQRERNESYTNQGLMYSQGGNMSNNSLNLRNTMGNNRFAQGGAFEQYGINMIPDSAGLHHQSAYGGVPIGPNALAEGGEIKMDNGDGSQYIVSDQVDGAETQKDFTFSKGGKYKELNRTLADGMKQDLNKYTYGSLATSDRIKSELRRPNDSYGQSTVDQIKEKWQQKTEYARQRSQHDQAIAQAEEQKRMAEEQYIAAYGGRINPKKYPGLNMSKKAKGGYIHNQMTQPMYAQGGNPWVPPDQELLGMGYAQDQVEAIKLADQQSPVFNTEAEYNDISRKAAVSHERGDVRNENFFNGQKQSKLDEALRVGTTLQSLQNSVAKPVLDADLIRSKIEDYDDNRMRNSFGEPDEDVRDYERRRAREIELENMYGPQDDYARGGQIDYTNDMYAGGGPMVGNVPQAFKGPAAQNRGGMYMTFADGGMMPSEQQMMQQAPQEQMQQQGGGQEQMMQMVEQAAQMLEQGAQPEQVMQQLVQAGVPQDMAMQAVQIAMQELQGQMQQQGQEQMMPPQQGMARGGMYPNGGPGDEIPMPGVNPLAGNQPIYTPDSGIEQYLPPGANDFSYDIPPARSGNVVSWPSYPEQGNSTTGIGVNEVGVGAPPVRMKSRSKSNQGFDINWRKLGRGFRDLTRGNFSFGRPTSKGPTQCETSFADGGMMSPQDGMASQVAQQLQQGAQPQQVLQQLVSQGMPQEQAMAMVQAVMGQLKNQMQQQQPQQQQMMPQQPMMARGGYFNGKKQYGDGDEWAPNQDSEGSSGTTFSPLSDESTMSKIAGLGQAVVPALTSAFAFNKLSKRKIKPTTMEAALQNRDAEISALRDEWRGQTESGLRQLRNVGQTAGSVAGNTRELILSSLKEGQKPIMQIYGEMSAANQQAQQQANLANKQATDDFAKENESMYQNAMQTGFEAAGQGVKNASSYYSDLEDRKLQRWQAMNTTGENWTWTPKGKAFRNKDGIYMINGIEVDPSTGNEI